MEGGNSSRSKSNMINITGTPPPIGPFVGINGTNHHHNHKSDGTNVATKVVGLPPTPPLSSTFYREQDHYMPIANVIRIMRRTLPPHAKISDDAKETVQECVSEFISFVTEEANERCHREQRKTITADDLIWALGRLGFDDYVRPLARYLHRYREIEGVDRGLLRSHEIVSAQRRSCNRYGLQLTGTSQESVARSGFGLMPMPTVMPPLRAMIQHPSVVGYCNDGPRTSYGLNMGFSPTGGDGSSPRIGFDVGGGSNNGPNGFDMPSGSTTSDAPPSQGPEMGFFDPLAHFK